MAFLPIIAMAASAVGAVGGGISQAQSASYQAAVASNNATIARQNAGRAAAASASQTEQEGLKARAQDATLKAAVAANNVDTSSGSAADVETSQRELGQLDTATVANKGAEQVYGYETQATSYQGQAALDRAEIGSDIAGGFLKGIGSLGGAASSLPGGTSQMSGDPSVPSQYQWMGGNPTSGEGDLQGADGAFA